MLKRGYLLYIFCVLSVIAVPGISLSSTQMDIGTEKTSAAHNQADTVNMNIRNTYLNTQTMII